MVYEEVICVKETQDSYHVDVSHSLRSAQL